MSHTSMKHSSSTGKQSSLEDVVAFGLKLLAISIENFRTMARKAPEFLPPMPDLATLRPKGPCTIPERECPPLCVCEVVWEAASGETLHLAVRVTNSSRSFRTFQLNATPFTGAGSSPGTIKLEPVSLSLAAGQSGHVNASFTVPDAPRGEYHAEIVVKGAYEQCVCVTLKVQCEKTCGEECCTCEVVQGDPPVRIRAHHWYDHFQCTEPCRDPQRQPNDRIE